VNDFDAQLAWTREHMPVTARAAAALPDLSSMRLACSMHLEIKMIPAVEGLLARGAEVMLTTCNPRTVDDRTVDHLISRGARAYARRGMTDREEGWRRVLEMRPTHLCEMGADLTTYLLGQGYAVKASLEATGSGVTKLAGAQPPYPIFNWDDLPIKEGLHNRRMVGLTACHAFFEKTRLTLHGKRVLVVGYGLVGRGVCDAVRAYGGRVLVAEADPARALEATFGAEEVVPLEAGLPLADVVVTATGARHVIAPRHLAAMKDGAFLVNVGHADEEIDLAALPAREVVIPFVERVRVEGKRLYLFAGGSMANLVAGHGDSINAFDVTAATMVAGVGFLTSGAERYAPGLHLLPREAWLAVTSPP
jgi:adenosylhomocysteinase